MPTALEYFEKCAGTRGENFLMGGTGFGVGADLAARNSGVALDQLDPRAMTQARRHGRAIEAVGALGLGALGGLGNALYDQPMDQWFDTGGHTSDTLHDLGVGATVGSIVGSYGAPAVGGYHRINKLIEEAKRRRADTFAAKPPGLSFDWRAVDDFAPTTALHTDPSVKTTSVAV